jgi:hypothetical protein
MKGKPKVQHEEWRTVVGFPDYDVSNLGRIRSRERQVLVDSNPARKPHLRTVREKIMSPTPDTDGYLQVTLTKDRVAYVKPVHRMVARAFAGKPPEGKNQAMHLDDDIVNNVASNLAWGTTQENTKQRDTRNRQAKGARIGIAKLTDTKARMIFDMRFSGLTQRDIGDLFGVDNVTVSLIMRGRIWRHATGVNHEG